MPEYVVFLRKEGVIKDTRGWDVTSQNVVSIAKFSDVDTEEIQARDMAYRRSIVFRENIARRQAQYLEISTLKRRTDYLFWIYSTEKMHAGQKMNLRGLRIGSTERRRRRQWR